MDVKSTIEDKITFLLRENQILKNELDETAIRREKELDSIFSDFVTVIDTFERAEQTIKEKNLIEDEQAQKVMKRLLNAKKKAIFILEKYNVKKIELEKGIVEDTLCQVVDTEPDSSRQNDEIISVEKDGYTRDDHVIRLAEVVSVKN